MPERTQANVTLAMTTLAFAVCFAAWMIYGVLITFLIDTQRFAFDRSQFGWLLGVPVLTGSILRLPVGLLTDRYGGRAVMTVVMLVAAVPLYFVSEASRYETFLLAGLGFGMAGASFAVGVAYVSVWFTPQRIGTALGIFGAGNIGAAATSIGGPMLLTWLTDSGANPDGWRNLPRIYAAVLALTAIVFWFSVGTRKTDSRQIRTMGQRLAPLRNLRVWRFGLYYFLVFGGFVALSQWLIPYCVNSYHLSVAHAGLLAAAFSLPSGAIRALGGWLADRFGARTVMYWILSTNTAACLLLIVPRMEIISPGQGVTALNIGTVTAVSETSIQVGSDRYAFQSRPGVLRSNDTTSFLPLPVHSQWHEPVVAVGQTVTRRQLLARGVTHIYFQANVWIFASLLVTVGVSMGIGMAAVFKHIPVYFPDTVGVTGGIVGVIGGLGGVVCPALFGYLLQLTGLWTSCWLFLAGLSAACLVWMHIVIQRMLAEEAPKLAQRIDG